jgi:hypothetical protein
MNELPAERKSLRSPLFQRVTAGGKRDRGLGLPAAEVNLLRVGGDRPLQLLVGELGVEEEMVVPDAFVPLRTSRISRPFKARRAPTAGLARRRTRARPSQTKAVSRGKRICFNVREIVRVAKNSHGGESRECRLVPYCQYFVPGAARGIRTPDPVITKDHAPGDGRRLSTVRSGQAPIPSGV